jgi:hypothetical protein
MWTADFWKQTVERAVKTFGQAVLAVLSVGYVGATSVPWMVAVDAGLLAAIISVLTSLVSALVSTEPDRVVTPSLVPLKKPRRPLV